MLDENNSRKKALSQTERRKLDHIKICLDRKVESEKTNGFDRYKLKGIGQEIDKDDIDLSTEFMGKQFGLPFFIEAMTGGAPGTEKINKNLAKAAQELSIGMGVGSQRAAIENPKLAYTYDVRNVAPDILLLGNLGIAQIMKYSIQDIRKSVEMINADALAIHYNPIQEQAQPEGDSNFNGAVESVRQVCSSVSFPVIIKEVGFGISEKIARSFEGAGVSAVDIAGTGGTNWAMVESYRSKSGLTLGMDAGIATADALLAVRKAIKIPLIASGGIRTGNDCAKAMAMGADIVGFALPLLRPAMESWVAVKEKLDFFTTDLKNEMATMGVKNIEELRSLGFVVANHIEK